MKKIEEAQNYLRKMGADGWLLYDFAHINPIPHLIFDLHPHLTYRRRFFYWIPVQGEPVKIVHAIESKNLDSLPGEKRIYSSWQKLHQELGAVLRGKKKVAMEYSPMNEIPYVSRVDGGTIDLVRSLGVDVVSSALFLPYFTAVLDESQAKSHMRAANFLDILVGESWDWIAVQLKQKSIISEYDVQQKILNDFAKHHLETESAPSVSVNENSADPHYSPTKEKAKIIREGDFILIDMWCKEKGAKTVYADITRVGVARNKPSAKEEKIFQIVRRAQRAAIDLVKHRMREKGPLLGFEVDDAARNVVRQSGYGEKFLHRTGHNIGVELHGSGANIDNLELHDVRPILPNTCFSIEPGIYLEGEFGVRLESDVYIDSKGEVHITGGEQDALVCLW